ncbi:hypothetical protein [uncultured Chryseobacterium sp.]|uniref:hypothetical protein n=1 Tax=uncultured Chryseobacterium sp. TaxID=259322 RepID=UPI0025D21810|nr:hypothetical protein [uncultured Chryseobacterium sp.]
MKNAIFTGLAFVFSLASCTRKEPVDLYPADSPRAQYDTAAVDSFSNGAVSVDIARQIRMSSRAYQDSVKEAIRLQQEEKKLREELEKENRNKADEEKKKADQEKQKPAGEAAAETKTD